MAVTRSFKKMVDDRLERDPGFREALLRESVETMLAGDMETGKSVLRDYIKATIGFTALGEGIGTPPKSLIRMFGPKGNPNADNLFRGSQSSTKEGGDRVTYRVRRGRITRGTRARICGIPHIRSARVANRPTRNAVARPATNRTPPPPARQARPSAT